MDFVIREDLFRIDPKLIEDEGERFDKKQRDASDDGGFG